MKPLYVWALKDKKGKLATEGCGMGPILFSSKKSANYFKEDGEKVVRVSIEVIE